MLSIDIIFHLTMGDLANPETYAVFVKAIEQGLIVGFLAGPPCETWSRARQRAIVDGRGPRPVRSMTQPHGPRFLTYKEGRQVSFGSKLLSITWRLAAVAMRCGASVIIEHPAEIDNDLDHASIWRLPIARFLLRFPCCRKVSIAQGHYRGISAKPTDLFLIHITDEAERILLEGRVSQVPVFSSIGLNAQGQWNTSVLKEYPPPFCFVLSELFHQSQTEVGDLPVPSWFRDYVENLRGHFDEQAEMGPDFCANGTGGNASLIHNSVQLPQT